MTTQACMGGWCTKRDYCANYHAASPDREPVERLCTPGNDGRGMSAPVRMHRRAGEWERHNGGHIAPASPRDGLS